MSKPGGDMLIFMPTERDILETTDALRKQLKGKALVLPLFGRLQGGEFSLRNNAKSLSPPMWPKPRSPCWASRR